MENKQDPKTLRELLAQLNEQGIHDHRRYDIIRKFLNFKARDKGVPISGSFELTPLCNLDCKMCYVHLNREQMRGAKLLSTEQWKDIMQQAIDAGMMYAQLTGGECLTYPGFKELYLFLRNRGVETAILSNGLLMDAEMVGFLKENPPSAIQITLYGASEDAYERVTGRRAFSTVAENMQRLQEAEMPLSVAVTPNAYMTDGEEIVRWLHENGFSFQINAGIFHPREETGRGRMDAEIATYAAMMKLQRRLRGNEPLPECDPESLPEPGGRNENAGKGVLCGAGRSGFSVDWQGKMRPCNNFPCEGLSIFELDFSEAWKRTNRLANDFPRPAECKGCAYKNVCKHCVAEHASGAPVGHASPLICAWGKQMISEGLLKLQLP